jgi:hypothetical protein
VARREREILEHAVHTVAEQAAEADDLVDEAIEVGHGRSDPLVVHAKMPRLELLKVKADLERETRGLLPQLREVRPGGALDQRSRDHTGPLVARRTSAARRTGGVAPS